jgi:hypothetical protein
MPFPELSAFARHHDATPADDRAEQGINLERLEELCRFVRTKNAPELLSCLEGASQFVGLLAGPAGWIDRDAAHGIAARSLALAEEIVEAYARAAGAAQAPAAAEASQPEPAAEEPAAEESAAEESAAEESAGPAELRLANDPDLPLERTASETEELGTEGLNPELPLMNDLVLGRMLIELGHATRDEVAMGLRKHRTMGLPVGECLLLTGTVTADNLLDTLKLQQNLRTGLDAEEMLRRREQERKALSGELYPEAGALPTEAPSSDEPVDAGMRVTEQMFIGEVLLGAGMITNEELGEAMNVHHLEGLRVGDALVRAGALTPEELETGLELQMRLRRVAGLKAG